MINEERIKEIISEAQQVVKTDKYSLDEEFEKQSLIFLNYSAYLADVKLERDEIRARLDTSIRTEFSNKTNKTPSETYVATTIDNDSRNIILTFYINQLTGILKSLEHKKTSLQELSQLYQKGYYSNPK